MVVSHLVYQCENWYMEKIFRFNGEREMEVFCNNTSYEFSFIHYNRDYSQVN